MHAVLSFTVVDPGFVKMEGRECKCSDAAPGLAWKSSWAGRGGGGGDSDTFFRISFVFCCYDYLHYGVGYRPPNTSTSVEKRTKNAEGGGGGGGRFAPPPGSATDSPSSCVHDLEKFISLMFFIESCSRWVFKTIRLGCHLGGLEQFF